MENKFVQLFPKNEKTSDINKFIDINMYQKIELQVIGMKANNIYLKLTSTLINDLGYI